MQSKARPETSLLIKSGHLIDPAARINAPMDVLLREGRVAEEGGRHVDLEPVRRSPERGGVVNVFPIAAATRGSRGGTLTDFRALQRAGAIAVTDDGKPILDDDIMGMALRLSAE